jgi:hypothetical protein
MEADLQDGPNQFLPDGQAEEVADMVEARADSVAQVVGLNQSHPDGQAVEAEAMVEAREEDMAVGQVFHLRLGLILKNSYAGFLLLSKAAVARHMEVDQADGPNQFLPDGQAEVVEAMAVAQVDSVAHQEDGQSQCLQAGVQEVAEVTVEAQEVMEEVAGQVEADLKPTVVPVHTQAEEAAVDGGKFDKTQR